MTELKLYMTEQKLDMTEPKVDMTDPKLDVTEPKLDVTEPKLDVTDPKLDMPEPVLANLSCLVVSSFDCSDRHRDSVILVMTLFRAPRHKHGEVGYHSTIGT